MLLCILVYILKFFCVCVFIFSLYLFIIIHILYACDYMYGKICLRKKKRKESTHFFFLFRWFKSINYELEKKESVQSARVFNLFILSISIKNFSLILFSR